MIAAKLATMKNGRPETTSIDAVSKAEACARVDRPPRIKVAQLVYLPARGG